MKPKAIGWVFIRQDWIRTLTLHISRKDKTRIVDLFEPARTLEELYKHIAIETIDAYELGKSRSKVFSWRSPWRLTSGACWTSLAKVWD